MTPTPLLLAGAAMLLPNAALAQATVDDKARIDALEARVRVLTEQIEALNAARTGGTAPAPLPASTSPATVRPTPAATPGVAPEVSVPVLSPGATRGADGRVVVPPTTLDRTLQGIGTWAEISAASDASQVSFRIGGMVSDPNLRGRPAGWARYDTWSLTASAPLGKTGLTDVGTLDGFVNSSKLKARWTQFRTRIARPEASMRGREIVAQARAACQQNAGTDCAAALVGDEYVRTWLGPAAQDEYLRLAFPAAFSWAYGLEGAIGYNKFSYVDKTALATTETKRIPWSAKGFVSALPAGSLSSWTAGLEYQRSFKEQDAVTICPPSGPGSVTCLTGPGGVPGRKSKLLSSIEYRRLFQLSDKGFVPALGLSAMVTYDIENDEAGVDVPIYLMPNDKGQMIGGLRFGYTSTKAGDDFVAGVFVGTAFSLFQ